MENIKEKEFSLKEWSLAVIMYFITGTPLVLLMMIIILWSLETIGINTKEFINY